MGHGTGASNPPAKRKVPTRAGMLALLAALAAIAAGIVAALLDGPLSAAFAGAAIVLAVTSFFCVGTTSLDATSGPPFDPDEPSATPLVPQSQVTLVYNPVETPNNSLECDAAKPRASG